MFPKKSKILRESKLPMSLGKKDLIRDHVVSQEEQCGLSVGFRI